MIQTGKLFLFVILLVFSVSLAGQNLVSGCVVADWNFTLKTEVQADDFEKFFLEELSPAYLENCGMYLFLLKGDRGKFKKGYRMLLLVKSVEERDCYWPQEGVSSEKALAAQAKLKPVRDKLDVMIEWGAYTEWIVK